MDQEGDPCEVKKASLKPKAPTADDPDSISSFDSDPSLSEEEPLTDEDIVESIYENLLQIILSLRLQQCSAEPWCAEDYLTPMVTKTFVPDACPGAPMQLSKIWRKNGTSGRGRRLFF